MLLCAAASLSLAIASHVGTILVYINPGLPPAELQYALEQSLQAWLKVRDVRQASGAELQANTAIVR